MHLPPQIRGRERAVAGGVLVSPLAGHGIIVGLGDGRHRAGAGQRAEADQSRANRVHARIIACPAASVGQVDGRCYVSESATHFGSETRFVGVDIPAGSEGQARVPDALVEAAIEAAEECPGECIFLEVES